MKQNEWVLVAAVSCWTLYLVGEQMQGLHVGPEWIRHHLSDVGIVGSLGFIIQLLAYIRCDPHAFAAKRVVVDSLFAYGLCVTYELFQFSTGRGDPIDIACYTVGLLMVMGALWMDARKVSHV